MTRYEWMDLSDSELRQRLERRGARPSWARDAAHWRDIPAFARKIDELLRRPAR